MTADDNENKNENEIVVRIVQEIRVIQETAPTYLWPWRGVTLEDPYEIHNRLTRHWDDGKPPWLRDSICQA
jgi:hypothetical protein